MNKIIQKELNKVMIANLDNFDITTNTYHISKVNEIKIELNKTYLIKLDKSLLNFETSQMLAINFNHNSVPTNSYMKVEINKMMNNLLYVIGIGYDFENKKDLNNIWSGWLPKNNIDIMEKID